MKAVVFREFGGPLTVEQVPDPAPPAGGAVIKIEATGLCRSDWHGWIGHDRTIELPHVPGHELAGTVAAVGSGVTRWQVGDRVTLPFVCGCGSCPQCASGNQQVCDHQFQPGFTHWGSFAEFVAVHYADSNLVHLPPEMDFVTAASLGCRFVTAYRAVVAQGRLAPGEWVAVHGCGGVGLSAIMIAAAMGARIVAVDIAAEKLALARELGAAVTVNAREVDRVDRAVRDATGGGAHLSLDALGSPETCYNSIANLRKRGRHVQIGLMLGEHRKPRIPMARVIAHELEILGSHGMQAHEYPLMMAMIAADTLQPQKLVGRRIALADAPEALAAMNSFPGTGVTVIETL